MHCLCNPDAIPTSNCRQPELRQKGDQQGQGGGLLPIPSFGGGGKDNSDFLVIDKNPRIGKDFRGCQMAVWSGLTGAQLPTESCANVLANAAQAVAGAVGGAVGGAANTLGGGFLGNRGSKPQGNQGGFGNLQKNPLGLFGK